MLVRRSVLLGFSMASAAFGLVPSRDGWAQNVRHLCSEKYQAAKAAGTLNGETWPRFYSKCTADAKANPAAAAAAAPPDVRRICSEKYQAAKAAGTLNGEAWPQFYSRCTIETKANPPAAATPPAAEVAPPPAPAPAAAEAPTTAVFPTAIAPAYANEKPGKARMKTCEDQYKANKATNANGGLKWIQKGGGYWSECNKRLKG